MIDTPEIQSCYSASDMGAPLRWPPLLLLLVVLSVGSEVEFLGEECSDSLDCGGRYICAEKNGTIGLKICR